jgi:hypothetical protein
MPILAYYTTETTIREAWAKVKPAEKTQILGFIDRSTSNKPYCDSPFAHYQLCLARFEGRQPQLTAGIILEDDNSKYYKPEQHGGVTARKMREILGLNPRPEPAAVKKTVAPLVLKKPAPKPLVLKPVAKVLPPLQLKKPAVKPLVLPKKKLVLPPRKPSNEAPF